MLIDNLVKLNPINRDSLTATKDKVLESETFVGDSGDIEEGTVPIINSQTSTIEPGDKLTIAKGYHTGSEIITAEGISSHTPGNATASNIESGYNAWVNGTNVAGSIPRIENATKYLNCGENHVIPYGIHGGGGKIQANDLAPQTQANATSGTILSGYNAWVNGSKINGNIQSMSGSTINPSSSVQTIDCAGKYMTSNIIINKAPNPKLKYRYTEYWTGTVKLDNASIYTQICTVDVPIYYDSNDTLFNSLQINKSYDGTGVHLDSGWGDLRLDAMNNVGDTAYTALHSTHQTSDEDVRIYGLIRCTLDGVLSNNTVHRYSLSGKLIYYYSSAIITVYGIRDKVTYYE